MDDGQEEGVQVGGMALKKLNAANLLKENPCIQATLERILKYIFTTQKASKYYNELLITIMPQVL